jgi:hypothetical protein
MGRCSEFVARQYGFPTETVARVVVLNAAAAVQVMLNDPNRVAFLVMNLGAALGYVAPTSAVAALFGILLAANGGVTGSNARDDAEYPSYEMWGIGAGATTLYVLETRAVR